MKFSSFYFFSVLSIFCFSQENSHASAFSSHEVANVMGLYDLDWEAAEQLLASGVLEQDTAPSRAPSVLSTVEQYGYSEAALLQAMASHSLSTYGEAATFLDDQARKAFEHTPIVISPLPLASSQSSLDLARRLQEEEQRSEKARQEKASREVIARLKEEERLAEQERQERASLELISRLQEEEKRTPTFSGSLPSESGVLSMEEIRRIARENVGRENIEFVVNGRRYTPQTFLESHPEPKVTAIGTGQMQFNKRGGHFYFPGEITWNSGSCSMEFMYDTGATDTSISQFAARKFFGVEIEDFDLTVHTANGEGKAARFLLPKLVVTDGENGFTFENVPLIVVKDKSDSVPSLETPLFGASLSDLLKVTSIGSKMIFETP